MNVNRAPFFQTNSVCTLAYQYFNLQGVVDLGVVAAVAMFVVVTQYQLKVAGKIISSVVRNGCVVRSAVCIVRISNCAV
jgi:hypothetical protein